jgi:hypothetical protein
MEGMGNSHCTTPIHTLHPTFSASQPIIDLPFFDL